MNGFLCVMKPPGMTSSDVVVRIRHKLGGKTKVGHAGTLDPEACGVLPVMVGKASRLFDYIVVKEKTYIAELITGYSTDTQDIYGNTICITGRQADERDLKSVLSEFTGDILQKPPMFSALKRDGKKLCDLARSGLSAEVEPRPVYVKGIEVLHNMGNGCFLIKVECGRGTYIRTLCNDIGRRLGCQACMGMLTRIKTGVFTLDDSHTVEEIENAENLEPLLVPMDMPLSHLPRIDVKPFAEKFARCGNPLTAKEYNGSIPQDSPVRIYLKDTFCGVGHGTEENLIFDAMLME